MSALEQSDADLYGFNWMDEGSQIAVSSIKGSVKTGVGSKRCAKKHESLLTRMIIYFLV